MCIYLYICMCVPKPKGVKSVGGNRIAHTGRKQKKISEYEEVCIIY